MRLKLPAALVRFLSFLLTLAPYFTNRVVAVPAAGLPAFWIVRDGQPQAIIIIRTDGDTLVIRVCDEQNFGGIFRGCFVFAPVRSE